MLPQKVEADFLTMAHYVAKSLGGRSERIYFQTFQKWAAFCVSENLHPLELSHQNVTAYLDQLDAAKNTKQRQLAALRKMAAMLNILYPDNRNFERYSKALKMVKAKGGSGKTRARRALSTDEVNQVLKTWKGDSLLEKRNQAIIAVLFGTGMRRTEIQFMRWEDIYFAFRKIYIPDSKGGDSRETGILMDETIRALQVWHDCIPNYIYCWPGFSADGKIIGEDKPSDNQGQLIYRVVGLTSKLAGIQFNPHDARRTVITDMIISGVPIHEVQNQAGHKRGNTTLIYAQSAGVVRLAKRFRLSYGVSG